MSALAGAVIVAIVLAVGVAWSLAGITLDIVRQHQEEDRHGPT